MSLLSIPALLRFQRDTGMGIHLRQNGYLLVTSDDQRADALRELASMQKSCGVQVKPLSVGDLSSLVPSLDPTGLVHAQIGLQDGFLDGPSVRNGYRQASINLGAHEILEEVVGVDERSLLTMQGEYAFDEAVLAAGHWSGTLNLELPIKPERHQLYWVEGQLPENTPFVIDLDTTFHYRPNGAEVMICYNDPELSSLDADPKQDPEFEPAVLDRLLPLAERRAPGLMAGKQVKGRAGYYCVTPDRHPILGRMGDVVVATGFGGHGVMHSPATGQIVSELILAGSSITLDIGPISPDRFARGALLQESWVF